MVSDSDDGHSSDDSLPTSPKPKKTNPKKKPKTDNKATASKRKRKIGTKNEKPKLMISNIIIFDFFYIKYINSHVLSVV